MRRTIAGLAVIATIAIGATSAVAASLRPSAEKLGAGTGRVTKCDPASQQWRYSFGKNSSGQVTSITVSPIAVACVGGLLSLTGTDSTGGHVTGTSAPLQIPSGTGSSCSTTCTQIVVLSTAEYPQDLTNLYAVITGP